MQISKLITDRSIRQHVLSGETTSNLEHRQSGLTTGAILHSIGAAMVNPGRPQIIMVETHDKATRLINVVKTLLYKLDLKHFTVIPDPKGVKITYDIWRTQDSILKAVAGVDENDNSN